MNWHTHEITNQFDELKDYNLFASDAPLQEALMRAGAHSFTEQLNSYGGV